MRVYWIVCAAVFLIMALWEYFNARPVKHPLGIAVHADGSMAEAAGFALGSLALSSCSYIAWLFE